MSQAADFVFAACRFNAEDLTLQRNGRLAPITRQTAEVLAFLLERRDRWVTRDELIAHFWAESPAGAEQRLHTCIRRIRAALGENGGAGLIETRPRVGYRFVGAVRLESRAARRPQKPVRWAGIAASLAATVGVAALAAAAASARTPDGTYRNDGYELRKYGSLSSNCDFDDVGRGVCTVKGDGKVEVFFRSKKLATFDVAPGAPLTCELQGGEADCG